MGPSEILTGLQAPKFPPGVKFKKKNGLQPPVKKQFFNGLFFCTRVAEPTNLYKIKHRKKIADRVYKNGAFFAEGSVGTRVLDNTSPEADQTYEYLITILVIFKTRGLAYGKEGNGLQISKLPIYDNSVTFHPQGEIDPIIDQNYVSFILAIILGFRLAINAAFFL